MSECALQGRFAKSLIKIILRDYNDGICYSHGERGGSRA